MMRLPRVGLFAAVLCMSALVSLADPIPYSHTEFKVPMRDGVNLAISIYTPEEEGPWPVILMRTPYNKADADQRAQRYLEAGYAYAIQDCRGRYESEGEYVPFENDMEDGYDTVEWLAQQPFCDGNVGIHGTSAPGITSNLAAAANPPHLKAAFVGLAPASLFSESRFIGGVFKESHAGGWMRGQGVADQIPGMKARVVMDDHWRATDFIHHRHNITIPMYNVGGWYDIFSHGNIYNFKYLQEEGKEGARGNQKLWMGPFGHGQISGDLEYSNSLGLREVYVKEEIRWFDYWLKGIDNGIMDEPPIHYYMMGHAQKGQLSEHNRLLSAETWPPESTPYRLYLQGDQSLASDRPAQAVSKTDYLHDPKDPVPTVGGLNLRVEKGPMDQRYIGDRDDYIRFESEPLTEDIAIAGRIFAELFVATDGPDTDFMVKLVDVYPDGYEAIVMDNPIRTRYRHGRNADDVIMMTPGKPEKVTVDLWSTALVFEKGHRIAVHISSSNFPRFDVNPNTGEAPGSSDYEPRVARNTIYHNRTYPSSIILPVVGNE